MLFLTAFWCRFCQLMDEEAFSDNENIALLNAFFVAIRAEDMQRPDVDSRYNLNGWPTIVFLSPQGKLLAATNYLPKEQFGDVLVRVHMGYQEKKDESRPAGQAHQEPLKEARAQVESDLMSGAAVGQVANLVMKLADHVHGGYGHGQKFIHPEVNGFLLSRYEETQDPSYLDHVCLTLDRMREGAVHDHEEEGYFRTTSGADWSQPHREKLLADQAGLLANCLRTFRLTKRTVYAGMAEGIIEYLDSRLSDHANGTFFGCEDFLGTESTEPAAREEFFTIIDRCIYTDANALAAAAYLDAAAILGKTGCQERALRVLEFLWDHCRRRDSGMCHYFDGAPHLDGMLNDQTRMGTVLIRAYKNTGEGKHLDRSRELADFVLAGLKNTEGGYFDLPIQGAACLGFPLTLIEQNGTAALFFLELEEITGEARHLDAAHWALRAFRADFSLYGIHAAAFGHALGELVKRARK